MNDSESRRRQMFVRVRDFGQAHTSDFAPTSLAQQYFTNIGTRIGEVDTHAASEASGRGEARQGTETRSQARAEIRLPRWLRGVKGPDDAHSNALGRHEGRAPGAIDNM